MIGRIRDLLRERRIDRLLNRFMEEPNKEKRRDLAQKYVNEINARSPGQIARLHRELGR